MTGRGIKTQRHGGRRPAKGGSREEGFLLTTLLQSALCAVMLVFAFAAGQYWGMTEVKSCFASVLVEETEAMEVFSAVKKARESDSISRLRDRIIAMIDEVLGVTAAPSGGMGGLLPADRGTLPSGVMTEIPILSAGMSQPIKGGLTSPFGFREHPVTAKDDFHTGIDLSAPTGTPIGAAYPGKVVEVGSSEIYGNYITLFHGGFATRYCHCDTIIAKEGMRLREGETVATVGSTGMVTGPHLHFELIIEGKNADPLCGAEGWEW